MENHDCRKSQVSHFFKNKSTPWLHDLTLAQHPTVKAAAIFRDKFCLIGFVFVTTAVIFILYYLSFMMKASPFRVLCWMIKKCLRGQRSIAPESSTRGGLPPQRRPGYHFQPYTFLCLYSPFSCTT